MGISKDKWKETWNKYGNIGNVDVVPNIEELSAGEKNRQRINRCAFHSRRRRPYTLHDFQMVGLKR